MKRRAVAFWKPNEGPQKRALASSAFELLFGGAAGGGKTAWLLAGATRYIDHPHFTGIFFRNSYKEALKISDQEARPLYEPLGGTFNKGDLVWNFPSGAKIYLSYLESDQDAYSHQGAAYQYVAFDELTHYSKFQYQYLFSRARSKHGLRCQVRATCNPEPGWVKERFGPWVDSRYEGTRASSGEILYVVNDEQGVEHYVPKGTRDYTGQPALSRCFIRSKLSDNPFLSGTAYASNLNSLDIVQRARLRDGDWDADYTPGLLFRRGMFRPIPEAPAAAIRVRSWDLAATEEKLKGAASLRPEAQNDPDWTVGVLYGWSPQIGFFIEHIERVRGRPEQAREAIARIAAQDAASYGAQNVVITLPQDPGAAGKTVAMAYAAMLSRYRVVIRTPTGSKVLRAGPASATAENLGIALVRGPWNEAFLQEAEQFPKGKHDDQIDGLSDAHATVAELREMMRRRGAQTRGPLQDFFESGGIDFT